MSDTKQLMQQARLMRDQTREVLTRLEARAHEFGLPVPPPEYASVQKKLDQDEYLVLVMGEAKRGKSTFINAMLGTDLLPVGVEVTTSQVFRVSNSPQPDYRLRFEDGSFRTIQREDLDKYGSQVVADLNGVPDARDLIRWIEVDYPAPFLPQGISILDTPGLGALYQEHKLLVQRYVPQADAVIFVLDSEAPILETELGILETVVKVTQDIFFIQTKTDIKNKEVWQDIHQRNEEILAQRFAGRLKDTRVWPIGSGLVRKASEENDEIYLKMSRFRDLKAALEAFLFRVAGWGRSADALAMAESYQQTGTPVLNNRLNTVSQESQQKRADIQQKANARRQQFESAYGENSESRRNLGAGLQKITQIGRSAMGGALNPGGSIELEIRRQIETTGTLEEIRHLTETMGTTVVERSTQEWSLICNRAQSQCAQLVRPFSTAGDALARMDVTSDLSDLSGPSVATQAPSIEGGMWNRIKGARMELLTAGTLAGLAVALVPPAWPFAALGALGAMVYGWRKTAEREREMSQQRAIAHLANIMPHVRAYFLNVNQVANRYSVVDEYFNNLIKVTTDYVDNVVKQKLKEAQDEVARLNEMVQMNEQARKEGIEKAHEQLVVWIALGTTIESQVAELLALQNAFSPSHPNQNGPTSES